MCAFRKYGTMPGLDQYVDSNNSSLRYRAAETNYALDRLIVDPDPAVRAEVARQGYGLNILERDDSTQVVTAVKEYLDKNNYADIDEWIANNPVNYHIEPFKNKPPQQEIPVTHSVDREDIKRALQVLIDNGIDSDDAPVVLQAICYTLLDTELFPETKTKSVNTKEKIKDSIKPAKIPMSPYEKTRPKVYSTGNKWAIENFEATH